MARPNPMWTTCPNCKTEIVTTTHKRISTFQCLVAACFCFICPCCFWIPYCIGDWKDVLHTCPNCNFAIGKGQSRYNIQSEDTVSQFGVSRFFSTKAIALAGFSAIFALITALVIISGYLVTCDELHYETRRQVLGRTTLGKLLYRKVASSNTSCLEAHAGFSRLLMKGIFDPYVL